MRRVTLFTDASWHMATGIGVWAMWAKSDGETLRYSGKLRERVPQIGTAELAAIANGLHCIRSGFNIEDPFDVLAQSDSLEAISAIANDSHKRIDDNNIVRHIKEFVRTNGWQLHTRHVKGHNGYMDPRSAVNTWCDRECRRRMGEALAAHKEMAKELQDG